jgi:hypothetical protein
MTGTRIVAAVHGEPHAGGMPARLNWLRAAVLGANDAIVSTAGLVVGVAGASSSRTAVLTAGLAGPFAGALAMASGEYVSVSSQKDSERAMLALERRELASTPMAEVAELARIYAGHRPTPARPSRPCRLGELSVLHRRRGPPAAGNHPGARPASPSRSPRSSPP